MVKHLLKMETEEDLIKCLICGQRKSNVEQLKDKESESSLIDKHLRVIFLLRNVLEVPSSKLVIFLKSHPKLEKWLSVCDKCTLMVNQCKSTYQNILEAQRKFENVKQEIIQVLKQSALIKLEISEAYPEDNFQDKPIDIMEEIRGFVYQNQYPENVNPFISGDHLAYQQLSHKVDKALQQLEEEDDLDDSDDQSFYGEANDDLQEEYPKNDTDTINPPFSAKCDLCGASYLNQSKLLVHRSNCSGKSIPCPVPTCPRKFSNEQVLTRHLRQFHGDSFANFEHSRTTCKVCGKRFPKIHLLKKHIRSVHTPKDNLFKCDLCGVGRPSALELENHRKNCQGNSLSCPMAPNCEMKCSNWTTLNYHVRTTHQDNIDDLLPFKCLECGDLFMSAPQSKTHLSKKHPGLGKGDRCDKDGGPFVCETCGGTYLSKYSLTNHRSRNERCKGLRGLVKQKAGEGEEEKPLICEICGKSFKNRGRLGMHVKVVHERRFVKRCEICGKGMSWRGGLEKHLWVEHKVGDGKKWGCGEKEVGDRGKVKGEEVKGERVDEES